MASLSPSSSHLATPQRGRPTEQQLPAIVNGIGGTVEDKNNHYLCPICLDLIQEAHITKCGHTFCYSCISKSLESSGRCPKCGFAVGSVNNIFPNFLLNELVSKYKAKSKVMLSLSQGSSREGVEAPVDGLRDFVATESQHLSLPDVNVILEVLTQRKNILESESFVSQNKLLHEFLKHLLQLKKSQYHLLSKEIDLIKKDLEEVDNILKDAGNALDRTAVADNCTTGSNSAGGTSDVGEAVKLEEDFNEKSPSNSYENRLAAKRRRMHAHFDDFVHCYFSSRAKEVMFGKQDKMAGPAGLASSAGPDDSCSSGLDLFRDNLVKFSRFSTVRPLATLNYSSDIFNNSTIVSSIEFDKDYEYFAIAGVTKRIKVFEYASVIRDVVDIHYPCVEMISSSKISCIIWNSYHKSTLASSDYEGAVTVWDTSTGQRTKTFQEHEKRCWSVDFNSVDSRLIASGSDDARVKLWNLNMEHSVASLEAKANVCCVKFNPCSSYHLAFGSADHCVHYYDLRNMREALMVLKGHRKAVSYVKFLNKEDIVSASTDSQLKMWNVKTPHCLRSFVGHINEKNFVGLATDGDYVACGSENNSLYIYYKGLTKQLFSFKFDAVRSILEKDRKEDDANEFVSAVCWRQHSNVVVSANSQGVIKVLDSGPTLKKGKTRVFYGLVEDFTAVAVVGLGKQGLTINEHEEIDEHRDSIRSAAAAGCAALKANEVHNIWVEDFGNAQLAAEGAILGSWIYQDLRAEAKRKPQLKVQPLSTEGDCRASWERGLVIAEAQNLARKLMDTPSNFMTPTIFGQCASDALSKLGVEVKLHDISWAEQQGMGAFLGVSQGSCQPPLFIEAIYRKGPTDQKPIVLVGKGVTFDSGGISIKPSAGMEEMRGDMGGAACVVGALQAVARLQLPVNVTALIPLCENMPSGSAVKPGDVVRAKSGKTIRVDNTDAEGRLILADALSYAATLDPRLTLDMATLTGAIRVALGGAATAVFTNSSKLFEVMRCSGVETGDRVWRMPLWQHYTKQVTEASNADVVNVGSGKGGGACTAAAFLKEFAPPGDWLHLDIAGVMSDGESISYLGKGMTGRPTRTIVEFIRRLS